MFLLITNIIIFFCTHKNNFCLCFLLNIYFVQDQRKNSQLNNVMYCVTYIDATGVHFTTDNVLNCLSDQPKIYNLQSLHLP